MSKKRVLAMLAAASLVGILALSLSQPAVGDAGCLTNDYLGEGGAQTIEKVLQTLPGAVGVERAKEVTMGKVGSPPGKGQVIGAKLVRLNDTTRGLMDVYLVATSVDRLMPIIGTTVSGTAPCEVSVVDALTGDWLYSYTLVTPDAGASFAEFPKLEP